MLGIKDGIDFLVMEYLKGEALARRLRKRGASAGAGVRIRYSDHRRVGYSAPAWGDSPRPEIREHHAQQDRAALSYWPAQRNLRYWQARDRFVPRPLSFRFGVIVRFRLLRPWFIEPGRILFRAASSSARISSVACAGKDFVYFFLS